MTRLGTVALAAWLAAQPVAAWQAYPGAICVLEHETPDLAVRLTYDPAKPEYTIRLTRKSAPWPTGPIFSMRFEGGDPNTISTTRHVFGDGGRSLMVTDSGFGNVLDGLQFNHTAWALIDGAEVPIPLAGAAPAVAAFRACDQVPGV